MTESEPSLLQNNFIAVFNFTSSLFLGIGLMENTIQLYYLAILGAVNLQPP